MIQLHRNIDHFGLADTAESSVPSTVTITNFNPHSRCFTFRHPRQVSRRIFARWCLGRSVFPDTFPCGAPTFPAPGVGPAQRIRCILIEVDAPRQPNRIRRRKPPHIRIIKPERIEMQPRLPIQVLPLEPQVLLLNVIRLAHLFQCVAPHPISRLPYTVPIASVSCSGSPFRS